MGEFLLLAIASAFYPLYLAVTVVAFATEHPGRVLVPYWLAAMTTLITIGLVITLVLDGASLTRNQRSPLSPALDITIGVLLLGAALLLRRGRRPKAASGPPKQGRSERMLSGGRPSVAAAVGVLMNCVPGPAYIIALKDITVGSYSVGAEVALIVVFNLFQLSLIGLPAVGLAVAPERTATVARSFNDWLRGNGRRLLAGATAALGLYLIGRGIYLLVT